MPAKSGRQRRQSGRLHIRRCCTARHLRLLLLLFFTTLLLSSCSNVPWNSPYPAGESDRQVLYTSFTERPKHLDPAVAYSSNKYVDFLFKVKSSAIAEVLSDMDAELAAFTQRRDKTRALKQGMMQELLTGRTRLV